MKKYLTKADILLIISILLICVILFAYFFAKPKGNKITISQNGKIIYSTSLNNVKNPITYKVKNEKNEDCVIVVIDNEGAFVSHSNCSDQICVHTGRISKVGQAIVCLPNKVIVSMSGEENSEFDSITG